MKPSSEKKPGVTPSNLIKGLPTCTYTPQKYMQLFSITFLPPALSISVCTPEPTYSPSFNEIKLFSLLSTVLISFLLFSNYMQLFPSSHKQEGWDPKHWSSLTIALSWELLACAIPRMFVVCITSTEKLGSQLAIREPANKKSPRNEAGIEEVLSRWSTPVCIQFKSSYFPKVHMRSSALQSIRKVSQRWRRLVWVSTCRPPNRQDNLLKHTVTVA